MDNKIVGIAQLKAIQLQLLKHVHEICEREGYRYSLGGGTLLGAIRHKGYIPWDDDIDIMMPRPDYDAFIQYVIEHDDLPFKIRSYETDKSYLDMSAKVYDPRTVLKDDNIQEGEQAEGVFIDVFVIDGLANTYNKAIKAFRKTSFKRALLVAAHWRRFFRSKTHGWYLEPIRLGMYVLSRFVNKRRLYESIVKRYARIDFNNVKFAAAVGGSYREKEILPQEVFTSYIKLPFEDYEFNAIAAYDKYLGSIYGDYMKLPPEDKRVSHHTFTAYYKESDEQ